MQLKDNIHPGVTAIVVCAAIIVVIGGVKSASDLLAPLLMSIFISIVCTPPLFYMQRKGIPTVIALAVILGFVGLFGVAIFSLITTSIDQFSQSSHQYRNSVSLVYAQLSQFLAGMGISLHIDSLIARVDPNFFLKIFNYLLNGLSKLVADGLIVFLTVLFILAEVATIPDKLRNALRNPDESMQRLQGFTRKVIHYLGLKTATGALTGICVAIMLWILEMDYIFLWAVLAFALNFIPYVGSIVAGLPPVLLGLIDHGVSTALWATSSMWAV